MPEGYEKMRDKFIQDGLSEEEAKRKAAAIWNSKHPENPVGRNEGPSINIDKGSKNK